jgi:hypothetical protein
MGACDKEGKGGKAVATAMRVVGNKEGDGNKEGKGVSNEGGVQQRGQWLKQQEQWQQRWWASNGNKVNSNSGSNDMRNGNGNEGCKQQRWQWQHWQEQW